MNYRMRDAYGVVHVVAPWPGMTEDTAIGSLLCRPVIGFDATLFRKHNFERVDDTVAVNCITCLLVDGGTEHGR